MHHVVIGAGPAGVTACETLRQLDPQADLTLIGDEPEPPYARMAIPYFLTGRIGEAGTHLRKAPEHFERHGIQVRRTRVNAVDTRAGGLELRGGERLGYDRLLIATGSTPGIPPVPGIDSPGVHPCWTLADAREIVSRARPGAQVLLMGAGFIGCIILESLVRRGVGLTVVEPRDRMVARMMNQTAGGLIKRWCQQRGVKVLTSTGVTGLEAGDPLGVELDDGQTLAADLVIRATGVRPNVDFLTASGIDLDQGVLVNECLRTNVEGVYAAGDACRGRDLSTGEFRVQAIQPTAVEHGRVAAHNMVREQQLPHRGNLNMNVLDTLGLVSSSFGLWQGVEGGDEVELTDPERFRYLNLQFQEDRLIGASSLGLTEHIGVIRGLIQTRTRLGPWKRRLLQDPTRLAEAYLGSVQGAG